METLLLPHSEVRKFIDGAAIIELLRDAFRTYSIQPTIPARRAYSSVSPGGQAMIVFPGIIPGIPAYTVKVHAKFPGQEPAIRGVVLLHAEADGSLLAIIDSGLLTAVRTGAAGALAADVLARADARRAAIIGAGAQGRLQLEMLARVRPIEAAVVHDIDICRAQRYAAELGHALQIPIVVAPTVEEALQNADIIITATWAREPFLDIDMVPRGAHITALGADSLGKCELSARLVSHACFVADDRDLVMEMGAAGTLGLARDAIHAELGEILAGLCPGRSTPEDITIFGGVGLPLQDLAAAWQVYGAARAAQAGQRLDFLS